MPVITGQFAMDVSPLTAVLTRLQSASMANQHIRAGMERGGESYLGAMDARFGAMEGGGWRPLTRRTVLQRVRQGFPGPQPILRRLGEVRRGLQRGAPGNRFDSLGDRVRVGYGGGAVHSPYPGRGKSASRATIAEIAAYHQLGPQQRTILVPPDEPTKKAIGDDVAGGLTQLIQAA